MLCTEQQGRIRIHWEHCLINSCDYYQNCRVTFSVEKHYMDIMDMLRLLLQPPPHRHQRAAVPQDLFYNVVALHHHRRFHYRRWFLLDHLVLQFLHQGLQAVPNSLGRSNLRCVSPHSPSQAKDQNTTFGARCTSSVRST
ncbi:unnamed protein product [Amoebophrya sp. A25]|nr:unnamed protein product [Amoebophrya sp. A25]|eukprot:GSA25T00024738001.1